MVEEIKYEWAAASRMWFDVNLPWSSAKLNRKSGG